MGMMKEFKDFAVKGNVVDMAVGIIVGAAFGKIVSSFVGDVIMPPIGVLLGGVDFTNLAVTIKGASGEDAAVAIHYGKFIQTVVDFLNSVYITLSLRLTSLSPQIADSSLVSVINHLRGHRVTLLHHLPKG